MIAPIAQRLVLIASIVPYALGALGWALAVEWAKTHPSSSMSLFSPAQLFGRGGWFLGWFVALGVALVAGANWLGGTRSRTLLLALVLGGAYAVVYGGWYGYVVWWRG